MRGYLKTLGWLFKLQSKTTTVGKHKDSDLCLQNGGVEDQHAVIELNEQERCFVLRDLNSAHGTYVNNCHIHNAAVRLSPGDEMHFGYGGPAFQLCVDSTLQSCPPVQKRIAWHAPMQVPPSVGTPSQFPLLKRQAQASKTQGGATTTPRPPSRLRPASAGVRRLGLCQSMDHRVSSLRPGSHSLLSDSEDLAGNTETLPNTQVLQNLLQEKEERLLRLGDEVGRLVAFEAESQRKDTVIAGLRDEVFALQRQVLWADPEISTRLKGLEKDISDKKDQIEQLKGQMQELQKGSSEVFRQSLAERDMKISSMRGQLEKLKRDNGMSAGLVTRLQKDLSAREKEGLALASEVDRLQQAIRQKDGQLGSMSSKNMKQQGVLLAREKEAALLHKRVEDLEHKRAELQIALVQKDMEWDSFKGVLDKERQEQTSLQADLEESRRQEQRALMELQQEQTRLERLRCQITQATCTSPRSSSPQDTVSDQQITEQISEFIREGEGLRTRVKELEEQLKTAYEEWDRRAKEAEVLRSTVEETCLQKAHSAPALQEAIAALQGQHVPPGLAWVHDATLSILGCQLRQTQNTTQALLQAGIDVSDYVEGIPEGIGVLGQRIQACEDEVRARQAELQACLKAHDQSREEQAREAEEQMHTLREELERQGQQLLQDAVRTERDRVTQSLSAQLGHLQELQSQNAELMQAMETYQKEEATLRHQLDGLRAELESLRKAEAALKEQVRTRETALEAAIAEAEHKGAELERRHWQGQEEEYREQVRQHAHTIVAMEQQLEDVEKERDTLRGQLRAAEEKLGDLKAEGQKNPEVLVLEESLAMAREALSEAREEVGAQGDVIAALSRELAIANARMSDMTGELSEQQKVELEQHRAMVVEQRVQLSMLTQKLSQMSQLVEQKGEELRKVREEFRQCQKDLQVQASAETPLDTQPEGGYNPAEVRIWRQPEGPVESRGKDRASVSPMSPPELCAQQVALMRQAPNEWRTQLAYEGNVTGTCEDFSLVTLVQSQESVEQTARLDLCDTLDLSERTYLDLVRALSEALEMEEVRLSGSSSLKFLPRAEREKLGSCRQRDLELLSERARCKEAQIQEYQREQEVWRQSQAVGQRLQGRLDSLREELQAEKQESSLLREALRRSQDRLAQELSLNKAIKERKGVASERLTPRSGWVVSHSCVQDGCRDKAASGKPGLHRRLKKKEYEVEVLKEQLKNREKEQKQRTATPTEPRHDVEPACSPATPPAGPSSPAMRASSPVEMAEREPQWCQ
ncbi:forkhead-associated domain-containing protein 1 isoform X2 [Brienomyrus brachyistius]|uniref:forkhead-associated domain-containing protein 1 isoform X2 n=1 Tax=Brienomyrus brachyistius TaxID=42636 RepID=UPI0020B421FC|nr:forkhead-associated domain-containing protein 1 isoform X2 [Brienomyrus brachyistius]